jgi:hypothetical protein
MPLGFGMEELSRLALIFLHMDSNGYGVLTAFTFLAVPALAIHSNMA